MTASFQFEKTFIDGLLVVQKSKRADTRGHLSRMFCANELAQVGWEDPIAQSNHTLTKKKGTVRGLHLQMPPYAETKLVTCLKGAVLDVAVDLRKGSPTYSKWFGCELTQENWKSLLIPKGFAHGFQTLSDDVEMLYFHDCSYSPDYETGINPLDKALAIDWPIDVSEMSERDRSLGSLEEFGEKLK